MEEQSFPTPQSERLAALRHDTQWYYRDHFYNLELMWTERAGQMVCRMVTEQMQVVPAGTRFAGMVIPSIDQEAVYLRVISALDGPNGEATGYLARRLVTAGLPEDLLELVYDGVMNRIAWAFLRGVWSPINSRATHYELARRSLVGLARRSLLRKVMSVTLELCVLRVMPGIGHYYGCHDITRRFVDQLEAQLIDVEYPDELRELQRLKSGLFASLDECLKD